MKNATPWVLSILLVLLAAGCAAQAPATTQSDDQNNPQESASAMPVGAGDALGATMFRNAEVQTADVRD